MKINGNYKNLSESYLFSEIAKRVKLFSEAHPEMNIIRMGIGDVTLPLCPAVTQAMAEASLEMGERETFHGYGPEQGYDFLKNKIQAYYAENGVSLKTEEIFISDGAKSDLGNILDLFDKENTVLIPDPVYPVYVDTNCMDGRRVIFADANEKNEFLPMPEDIASEAGENPEAAQNAETGRADIIYLCSPNNPTGAVYSRKQLEAWVAYARKNEAVILFDAAYESFINEESTPDGAENTLPRSIFEIEGARSCAIEFCSLSKTAGFTGTRCGYTVVPMELCSEGMSLNKMWLRRQTTKFNGVSYIIQRGAEAVFTEQGRKQIKENIDYYRKNAKIITDALDELGIWYTGGKNSPYIWLRCPGGLDSWTFFDKLLSEAGVVGTPGAGFGKNGTNFFRLTAFSTHENTIEAMKRLKALKL